MPYKSGLAIARGNYLDAVLSGVSLVPLVGLLAAVPKLALLINKIRTLLAGLGSQARQIVSDLITSISNVLSKWPASNDGSAASTIKAVLVQLKEVFQDATTRLRRSKAKGDAPSDAPPGKKEALPNGDSKQPSSASEKRPRAKDSSEPTPDPSASRDGSDLVRGHESSLDDATKASIMSGETPAGFERVDKSWKDRIEGKAQKTRTPGHQVRVYREAIRLAKTGEYERVYLNRSYGTATGVKTTPKRLPDVIGVRKDGKVDVIEVPSKTDKDSILTERNKRAMSQLPSRRRGEFEIRYIQKR